MDNKEQLFENMEKLNPDFKKVNENIDDPSYTDTQDIRYELSRKLDALYNEYSGKLSTFQLANAILLPLHSANREYGKEILGIIKGMI